MSGPVGNLQGFKRTVASLTIAEGTQISHFFSFIECPCLYSYENSPVCCPLVVLDTTSNLKAELSDYDSEPRIRFTPHTLPSTPCRWFWTGLTTALCQRTRLARPGVWEVKLSVDILGLRVPTTCGGHSNGKQRLGLPAPDSTHTHSGLLGTL